MSVQEPLVQTHWPWHFNSYWGELSLIIPPHSLCHSLHYSVALEHKNTKPGVMTLNQDAHPQLVHVQSTHQVRASITLHPVACSVEKRSSTPTFSSHKSSHRALTASMDPASAKKNWDLSWKHIFQAVIDGKYITWLEMQRSVGMFSCSMLTPPCILPSVSAKHRWVHLF